MGSKKKKQKKEEEKKKKKEVESGRKPDAQEGSTSHYREELDALRRDLGLDYETFESQSEDADERQAHYERAKDHFVRGEVILTFLQVDEFLNLMIRDVLFRSGDERRRAALIEAFEQEVLLPMPTRRKIAFVRTVMTLPKYVRVFAQEVTNLRNALAPEFSPREGKRKRTRYKDLDIYTPEGLRRFEQDADRAREFMYQVIVLEPRPDDLPNPK